jgi:hypothetical protein
MKPALQCSRQPRRITTQEGRFHTSGLDLEQQACMPCRGTGSCSSAWRRCFCRASPQLPGTGHQHSHRPGTDPVPGRRVCRLCCWGCRWSPEHHRQSPSRRHMCQLLHCCRLQAGTRTGQGEGKLISSLATVVLNCMRCSLVIEINQLLAHCHCSALPPLKEPRMNRTQGPLFLRRHPER